MPMFWGDYLRDTGHLSPAEHGAYLMLIAHQWTTAKPLPDSDVMLARIAKMTAREWRSAKPVIEPFFTVRNGEWSQKRVEAELIKAKQAFDKRRTAGSKGGSTTQARLKQSSSNASRLDEAKPKPEPKPKPERASSLADLPGSHVRLSSRETFFAACWKATDCDPDKHPFTEVTFGQWFSEGCTVEDLAGVPAILERERIREGNPSLVKQPGYFTPAVRRARMERQAVTTAGDALLSEIDAAWEKINAA
jgi:uncharacterized protein YdaU (DUF1376 family)